MYYLLATLRTLLFGNVAYQEQLAFKGSTWGDSDVNSTFASRNLDWKLNFFHAGDAK